VISNYEIKFGNWGFLSFPNKFFSRVPVITRSPVEVNEKLWKFGRSQRPRGLRRGSAAARLLSLWLRIPLRAWMSVCCECCVLSGRGLCDGLITCPEESYKVWCVCVCVCHIV
jgi:hypothetical protein